MRQLSELLSEVVRKVSSAIMKTKREMSSEDNLNILHNSTIMALKDRRKI